MAISLSQETHLITVDPETVVTVQQLLNAARAWEATQWNMDCAQVAEAAGKQVLSETTQVGVTLTLLNWKVFFGDRGSPVVCSITDGNLVAVDSDGYPMSPIEPSENVTAMVSQSASATMIQDADIDTILARIGVPGSTIALDLEDIDAKVVSLPGSLSTTHGDGSWEGAIEWET